MAGEPEPALDQLATEAALPAAADLDRLATLELARVMNEADATVAPAVARCLPQIAAAIDGIAARLAAGGRLIYMGAGTSGRLGLLDAAECPPTFNTPPDRVVGWIAGGPGAVSAAVEGVEDDSAQGAADVAALAVSAQDAVVGLTASGRTPYVLGALAAARAAGALTIAIACNAAPAAGREADLTIAMETGPEVIGGSTRLKAGTAQKMALNMISTGVMVRLGKTYGSLMVDVQPTNAKLRRRAARIVATATGLPLPEATRLLVAANNEPKTAIVAALTGGTPDEARARLAQTDGRVREALALPPL
jgi:N-acetylmuramic acid 6-phosphate etherase